MKTLVTGGGGFLGRYIVEQLRARGDEVRILSRGRYAELEEIGVESIQGDVRNAAIVEQACRGVDVVFHTAAVAGIWGPWKHYHSINTQGTLNVIAACRVCGVKKLVFTSSPSVVYDGCDHHDADETLPYPTSYLCHYPHTKALAEQAVLAANGDGGLLTTALRPHLIWGPRDNHLIPRLIQKAKAGRLRRVGSGENLISMVYVENAAHAHLLAADALSPESPVGGQAYFINEPAPVNQWGWIDELLVLGGLPPVEKSISANFARRLGAVIEFVYRACGIRSEPPMTRFLAAQLSTSHYYSIERARRDFGFEPIVSVETGMQRIAEEIREAAQCAGRP